MGEITLVRHGQANSAAKTEADYDRLTELGHEQARLLGQWMAEHDGAFDTVMAGSLRRQQETAAQLGFGDVITDPRLNEIAYYDLTDEMDRLPDMPPRNSPGDFAVHFPATLSAWRDGRIAGAEPYGDFVERVAGVIALAAQPGRRVLCVTSGGIIAQAVSGILKLDIPQMAQLALPIFNTSVHRIVVTDHGPILGSFNATPHLDHPDRQAIRTHY
jgi:broad specificity phosphatase PhoE